MDFSSKKAGLTRQASRTVKGASVEAQPRQEADEEIVEVEEGSGIDKAHEGKSWREVFGLKGEDDNG